MSAAPLQGRELRLAEVIGAVARQALRDRRATRVALLDDGSPEAALAARLLSHSLGDSLVRVGAEATDVDPVLQFAPAGASRDEVRQELRRLRARLLPGALPADPGNKTALLLGGALPPEPLLPLGDLYASQVLALAGGWSAPPAVLALAERAGGIERLDAALRARYDERDAAGLDSLSPDVRADVADAAASGRAARVTIRVVPKIGHRTIGLDLLE